MNDHDVDMDDAAVANATMMGVRVTGGAANSEATTAAHGGSEEASSTDDEELQQQLSRADTSVQLDLLNGDGGGEVKFEDLLSTVFTAAKEAKVASVNQCFRIIKKSANGVELMQRTVEAEDETGLTLLMVCVRNNILSLTTLLLQEGADLNHSNVRARVYWLNSVGKHDGLMTRSLCRTSARTRCCSRRRKD